MDSSFFDRVIPRYNTMSVKFDFAAQRGVPTDAWPMWVADMDFQSPPEVIEALHQAMEFGVFGYSHSQQAYDEALCSWYTRNFGWTPNPSWAVQTPGVMFSVSMAIQAMTDPGDAILIQQPVYYPFMEVVEALKHPLIINELVRENGHYRMDIEAFERLIVQHQVKLFLFCTPHNPVGRVWTREELRQVAEICLRHGVQIIADEIHADFVYPGHQHTNFLKLCAEEFPELVSRTVLCTSPSKTFNLAGLQAANAFVPNPKLRRAIVDECLKVCYEGLSIPGIVSTQAAYAYGQEWKDTLVAYLYQNIQFASRWFRETPVGIDLIQPEGTYLLWLDCHRLCQERGLDDETLNRFFTHEVKLWLNRGTQFGRSGSGFMRMNIGCPRATLEMALERIAKAVLG